MMVLGVIDGVEVGGVHVRAWMHARLDIVWVAMIVRNAFERILAQIWVLFHFANSRF